MDKEEADYVIQRSLRDDFDQSNKYRQIEIYKATKHLQYLELAEEMKSDFYADYNINLN